MQDPSPRRIGDKSGEVLRAGSQLDAALGRIVAFLQPIVSVRQREVRLVEALARSIDPSGRVRSAGELFADAQRQGLQADLEQHCRRAAYQAYRSVAITGRAPVLSLNTDTSLILAGARGADRLATEILEAGISPVNVALEILESALSDMLRCEEFCRAARKYGFLIALDDVGTGHSNLERIPRLEPDILKIDRVLVHGVSGSFHRREVFRSLVQLSHQIGALAIAEGVENESDVLACLSLGCDMFQGFYFGKPRDPNGGEPLLDGVRLHEAGDLFRARARRRLNDRRARQRRSEQAMRALMLQMKTVGETAFDSLLRQALSHMPFVEALYVLDERGVQMTDTIHRGASSRQALFQPAPQGADQSLKPYFLMLFAGLERFTSEPYISSASGNFCITMSRQFSNVLGQTYVLCCDLMVPRESEG